MRFHLPQNPLHLEILGAVLGMGVALLIYLGFQQYSFSTLRGSLVDTAASPLASLDTTASIQAAGDQRIAERDQLTQDRLAALADRHPSSAAATDADTSSSISSAALAPSYPGNLSAPVSEKERLTLRAKRFPTADRVGDVSTLSIPSAAPVASAPRELAGVPIAPSESQTMATPSPAPIAVETSIAQPARRPLPQSGPAEDGIILLAFAAALTFILRRQRSTQAAD